MIELTPGGSYEGDRAGEVRRVLGGACDPRTLVGSVAAY